PLSFDGGAQKRGEYLIRERDAPSGQPYVTALGVEQTMVGHAPHLGAVDVLDPAPEPPFETRLLHALEEPQPEDHGVVHLLIAVDRTLLRDRRPGRFEALGVLARQPHVAVAAARPIPVGAGTKA